MAYELENDLFENLDMSILEHDQILELLSAPILINLVSRIKSDLVAKFEANIESCEDEADLDLEPGENFEDVSSSVSQLVEFLENKDTEAYASAAALLAEIERATLRIAEKKEERQKEREREQWMWEELSESVRATGTPTSVSRTLPTPPNPNPNPRSIFSDVDQ